MRSPCNHSDPCDHLGPGRCRANPSAGPRPSHRPPFFPAARTGGRGGKGGDAGRLRRAGVVKGVMRAGRVASRAMRAATRAGHPVLRRPPAQGVAEGVSPMRDESLSLRPWPQPQPRFRALISAGLVFASIFDDSGNKAGEARRPAAPQARESASLAALKRETDCACSLPANIRVRARLAGLKAE